MVVFFMKFSGLPNKTIGYRMAMLELAKKITLKSHHKYCVWASPTKSKRAKKLF
jgi:hypothetical protein